MCMRGGLGEVDGKSYRVPYGTAYDIPCVYHMVYYMACPMVYHMVYLMVNHGHGMICHIEYHVACHTYGIPHVPYGISDGKQK